MIQRILVPVDGSEHATKAVALAGELGARFGASILLLHVLTRLPAREQLTQYLRTLEAADEPDQFEIESVREVLARCGETEGEEILAEARRQLERADVSDVATELVDGEPATEIIRRVEAGDCDVVVMGRRGLGGLKGLVMGSVSYRVLHSVDCAVVSVK